MATKSNSSEKTANSKKTAAAVKKKGQAKKLSAGKILSGLARMLVALALPAQILLPLVVWPPAVDFLAGHLSYLTAPVVLLASMGVYVFLDHSRTHPPKDKRGKPRRPAKPPRVPLRQLLKNYSDVIGVLDLIPWRIAYLVAFIATIIVPLQVPIDVHGLMGVRDDAQPVLISFGVPLVLALALVWRLSSITRSRSAWIEEVYAIARDTFDYKPLPERGTPTKRQRITATPHLAIEVRKWKSISEGDTAFVWVPEKMSVSDQKTWDEFAVNLDEKMPREEEWRIRTKGFKGRGALIGPANYPRAVLWDGEYDPDPLTFFLAVNLETGATYKVTLNSTTPHIALSGGTSSGKSSAAEIIVAQALMTPMPWDPDLYGTVDILDPKSTFAGRWVGRPGVVVSDGVKNSEIEGEEYVYNEDGDVICEKTGVMVMAEHLRLIEAEYKRRADVLSKYSMSDAADWLSLPPDVLRQEQFAPKFVILDEFLDHTAGMKGKDDRIVMENEAREYIVNTTDYLGRKARNVGIHLIVIAQRANMKLIGDTIMTNLPIRIVTGDIDDSQLGSMFGIEPSKVPHLPTTYLDPETGEEKKVQGRARIVMALGQPISKVQVMWFGGGKPNNKSLNKWLPRGSRPVNGDFNPPTGTAPRKRADFDANGNLITPDAADTTPDPATGDGTDNPTEEALAAPEATSVEPEVEDAEVTTPAVDASDAFEDDEQPAPDVPETSEHEEEPDVDDSGDEEQAIFPAAVETDHCAQCDAESTWTCPLCETTYCTDHGDRTRNPDPEADARFVCGACAAKDPLVQVGLVELLADVTTKTARYQLHCEHSIQENGTGQFGQLVIRTDEGGKKIVEAFSRPDADSPDGGFAYRARSSSGTVDGLANVQNRIEVAISTYVRKRHEQQAPDTAGQGQPATT